MWGAWPRWCYLTDATPPAFESILLVFSVILFNLLCEESVEDLVDQLRCGGFSGAFVFLLGGMTDGLTSFSSPGREVSTMWMGWVHMTLCLLFSGLQFYSCCILTFFPGWPLPTWSGLSCRGSGRWAVHHCPQPHHNSLLVPPQIGHVEGENPQWIDSGWAPKEEQWSLRKNIVSFLGLSKTILIKMKNSFYWFWTWVFQQYLYCT